MRVTTKGQVTIPKYVRDHLGIIPGSEVAFEVEGNIAYLRKAHSEPSAEERRRRFDAVMKELEKIRGLARGRLTADEIMTLTRGDD
jgi:AbrB family looped-hinge helix DNA binding protein